MPVEKSEARLLAEKAFSVAQGYADAHTHEEGGNNHGDQVEFFLKLCGAKKGDPWCAAFVSTCRLKGWAQTLGLPEDRTSLLGYVDQFEYETLPVSASCAQLWKMAKARGLNRGVTFRPLIGDLVLFDFNGQGEPHHIGIVRGYDWQGKLLTVEGNTSGPRGGSQADGDGVFLKIRTPDDVFGFIHFK